MKMIYGIILQKLIYPVYILKVKTMEQEMKKFVILTLTAVFLFTMSISLSGCDLGGLYPEPNQNPTPEPKPKPEPSPEPDPAIAGYKFPFDFSVEGLYGETVTGEDLGEKELFMVYLWAVW